MYTFSFSYTDNTYQTFENITRVEYYNTLDLVVVSKDEILNHKFPVKYDLYLFAENANYSVSSKNLKTITVFKTE